MVALLSGGTYRSDLLRTSASAVEGTMTPGRSWRFRMLSACTARTADRAARVGQWPYWTTMRRVASRPGGGRTEPIVAAQRSTHSGRNAQLQRALPPAIAVDGRRVRLWLCSPWTGVSATTLSALVGEAESSSFGLALATGCDHHRAASLSSF